MNAYLINPDTMTIEPVEYDGNYKTIYKLIDCHCFDAARFNRHGDVVFVDDEGLISGKEQGFFVVEGYPNPLAGKGLVLGCDMSTGDSAEPHVTLEWMRDNVMFVMPARVNGEIVMLPLGQHGELQ